MRASSPDVEVLDRPRERHQRSGIELARPLRGQALDLRVGARRDRKALRQLGVDAVALERRDAHAREAGTMLPGASA